MFVVADLDAMRGASREVLAEADGIAGIAEGLDLGAQAVRGSAIAAAVARAESRMASSIVDLAHRFSVTALAVDGAAGRYSEVDTANASSLVRAVGADS